MHLRLALAALILLAPPASAGSSDVRGELQHAGALHLDGHVLAQSATGVVDLAQAAPLVTIEFGSLEGYVSTSRWTETRGGPAGQNVSYRHPEPEVRPLGSGPGQLAAFHCGSNCRLALFENGDARLGMSGRLAGPLRTADAPHTYWGGFPSDATTALARSDPDAFAYDIAEGWLRANASGIATTGSTGVQDAAAIAEGALRLLLVNVTLELLDENGDRESLDITPTMETVSPGVAGAGEIVDRREPYALVELHGARLTAPAGAPISYAAPAWTMSLDGALRSASALGWIAHGPERVELRGDALQVEGSLTLDLARTDALLSAPIEGPIGGIAERVRVNGATIGRPSATSTAVASSAVGIGLAALALATLAYLQGWLYAPFYSRLRATHLLENERRRAVYDLVRAAPGASVPRIRRELALARVVVEHHVRLLQMHGYIVLRQQGRTRCYYLPESAPPAPEYEHPALRDANRQLLLRMLEGSATPPTQRELSERSGLSQRLVSYHLARLERAGLVQGGDAIPKRYTARAQQPRGAEGQADA